MQCTTVWKFHRSWYCADTEKVGRALWRRRQYNHYWPINCAMSIMQRLRLIINGESARDRFNYVTSPEMAIPIETNVSEIGFNQCAKRNWRMNIRSIYLDTQRCSRFVETATRSLIINWQRRGFDLNYSPVKVSINLYVLFFFLRERFTFDK